MLMDGFKLGESMPQLSYAYTFSRQELYDALHDYLVKNGSTILDPPVTVSFEFDAANETTLMVVTETKEK